jgi:glucose-1-phosphate cytidylyltransferase
MEPLSQLKMKAVILAGGMGTRLSEETGLRPKPMVEIGERPILWHIMKIYSAQGVNDFIVCCGYKGHLIKEYFAHYFLTSSDITFDLANDRVEVHRGSPDPWRVTLVDTGEGTMTGGRIRRIKDFLNRETFYLAYGDCLADINIRQTLEFHREQHALATLTAVQPQGRFGTFNLPEGETRISAFREKSQGDGAWINGGFFVLEPEAIDYIADETTVWEQEPLEQLAHEHKLSAYRHHGFWHPMDTLRDKGVLDGLWRTGNAPWKIWQ